MRLQGAEQSRGTQGRTLMESSNATSPGTMSSPRGALRETATLIGADFAGWRGQSPSKPGVLYACTPTDHTCDALVSGYDLYISKSCSQTRCSYCMIEEIDTHLCPHDLDNYPAHEAMKMQNRSNKSVECPACGTHLHVDNENSEWFFRCHWCWWDSRPLGLVGNMADDVIKELRRKERESDQEQEMERLVKQFSASAVEAAAAAADAQKQRRGLASAMGIFGSGAKLPQKSTDEITMEWETKQRALGYEGPREESICSPVKLPPAAGAIPCEASRCTHTSSPELLPAPVPPSSVTPSHVPPSR